jgi:hypothetical protein
VIAFGHESGATVVAEGVERLSQLEALRELGCDGAQGYLFGRPVQVMELLGFSGLELPTCTGGISFGRSSGLPWTFDPRPARDAQGTSRHPARGPCRVRRV